MRIFVRFCAVATVAAGIAATAPSSWAEDCKTFGAVGSGINNDVASLMAKQGAVNIAEARGYSVQGPGKISKCVATGFFGTECTAYQRACKSAH